MKFLCKELLARKWQRKKRVAFRFRILVPIFGSKPFSLSTPSSNSQVHPAACCVAVNHAAAARPSHLRLGGRPRTRVLQQEEFICWTAQP